MPNRVLRDWTSNDNINNISVHSERFFTRLIMKVDDFGCFYADTRLLKANLFPLLLDSIREADLSRWVAECKTAGLIVLYESNGKKYLQIQDFRQRLDRMSSKFPKPDANQRFTNDNHTPPETETETETNPKQETEVEGEKFQKIFSEIISSITWQEAIAMQMKKGIQYIGEKLFEFLNELKLKDDYYKGIPEIKKHFINWLKIQIEKEKNSAKKENGNSKTDSTIASVNRLINGGE